MNGDAIGAVAEMRGAKSFAANTDLVPEDSRRFVAPLLERKRNVR